MAAALEGLFEAAMELGRRVDSNRHSVWALAAAISDFAYDVKATEEAWRAAIEKEE